MLPCASIMRCYKLWDVFDAWGSCSRGAAERLAGRSHIAFRLPYYIQEVGGLKSRNALEVRLLVFTETLVFSVKVNIFSNN